MNQNTTQSAKTNPSDASQTNTAKNSYTDQGNRTRTANPGAASSAPEAHHDPLRFRTRLVPFTTQIPWELKMEIQRQAREAGLSDSATGVALLAKSMQSQIAMQFGEMFKPVLEAIVRRSTKHNTNLSFQAYYAAEQARILGIHNLRYLLGDDIEELPLILTESQKQAVANLKRTFSDTDIPDFLQSETEERAQWPS